MSECTCGQAKALADIHYPYCAINKPLTTGYCAAFPPKVYNDPNPKELEAVFKGVCFTLPPTPEINEGRVMVERMTRRFIEAIDNGAKSVSLVVNGKIVSTVNKID